MSTVVAEPRTPRSKPAPRPVRASGIPGRRWQWAVVLGVIFVLAFAARFLLELRGPGLTGIGAYDDGVYYAAAVMMVHGHLPYSGFLFLQPPAVAVLLTPFAALATVAGDPVGLAAGRVAFQLVGALNAVLVAVALRRSGIVAAIVGGGFYAVFFPAVFGERSTLIEPFATTGVLVALALRTSARADRRWVRIVAGAGLGLALSLKLWYVVPALVVVIAWRRGRLLVAAAAVAAAAVITLPFILGDFPAALREIVLDQLGRPRSTMTLEKKLQSIFGVIGPRQLPPIPGITAHVTVILVLLVCAAALGLALIDRRGRVFGVLAIANLAVLVAAPSYFLHYASLTAFPLALVLGVAAGRLAGSRWGVRSVAVLVVAAVLIAGLNLRHDRGLVDRRTPTAALQAAGARMPRCVQSDDPTVLATMDLLTKQVAAGCELWPDVTGHTYDRDDVRVDGKPVSRPDNARWQRDVYRYLSSGDAVILARTGTGLSAKTHRALSRGPILFQDGSYVVHRTER